MKSLIKTYIDPMLDDQIKILASKHNLSVSALVSELLHQALNKNEAIDNDTSAKLVEEQLYLQYFILTTLLNMNIHLDQNQYTELKMGARSWAQKRVKEIHQDE